MKALSLWQPWATLLVTGHKRVETRSWAIRHRGPLLIHAAKHWTGDLAELCRREPFRPALDAAGAVAVDMFDRRYCSLDRGCIIGRVDVAECFPVDDISFHHDSKLNGWRDERGGHRYMVVGPREVKFGDYGDGRFVFLCENPVRFADPIPCVGRQGLFEVEDSLLPALTAP